MLKHLRFAVNFDFSWFTSSGNFLIALSYLQV